MGGDDEESLVHPEVFYWIVTEDAFREEDDARKSAHRKVKAEEVAKKHGIPMVELQKYVESVINRNEAFMSMPFTLLFVAAYAAMVIVHDDSVVIRAVENSIEYDIVDNANFAWDNDNLGHKAIHDINSITDFWSWARTGLLPILFVQEKSFAESRDENDPLLVNASKTYSRDERGVMLNYNRIIGGVRMRQERSQDQECVETPEELVAFNNRTCVGLAYELDPEAWHSRGMDNPQRVAWLYVREDYDVLERTLVEMEAANWVDRYTQRVEITVPIYTAEFGLHCMISINMFFSRGGHIWKRVNPFSTYANWWTYSYYIAYDSVWLACLLHTLRSELKEIRRVVKQKGCWALQTDYIGFWNAVDWCSVFGGLIIVGLCIASIQGTNRCNADTAALDPQVLGDTDSAAYRAQVTKYVDSLESVVLYVHTFKIVLSAYPLIIVLRLFKAFSAQPRLALVTDTLAVTCVDLVHFLLVFMSIFLTLAISGLILFGRQLESFTTIPRAMTTVFRAMLGDFDWDELRSVGLWEAFIWLFFTLVIMNLLLLNMVLAIVMDGYSEVKRSAGSAATLPADIWELATHWWGVKRGELISLEVINRALLHCQREFKAKRKEAQAGNKKRRPGLEELEKLLGRDTIPIRGMQVEPVDEEIAKFVGPGKVTEVGHLLCRVLHEDGSVREYSVGHDLNYELKYVEGGVECQELGEYEEMLQNYQVISKLRFVKVVSGFANDRMSDDQALELITAAIIAYHKAHSHDGTDLVGIRHQLGQVMFRSRRMKQIFKDGGARTLSLGADEEMRLLREQLTQLYATVADDRRQQRAEMRRLRRDIQDDYHKLLRLQPEAMLDLQENADPEVFHELFDDQGEPRRRHRRDPSSEETSTRETRGWQSTGEETSAGEKRRNGYREEVAVAAAAPTPARASAPASELPLAPLHAKKPASAHVVAPTADAPLLAPTTSRQAPGRKAADGRSHGGSRVPHPSLAPADVVVRVEDEFEAEDFLKSIDATLRASAEVRGLRHVGPDDSLDEEMLLASEEIGNEDIIHGDDESTFQI